MQIENNNKETEKMRHRFLIGATILVEYPNMRQGNVLCDLYIGMIYH